MRQLKPMHHPRMTSMDGTSHKTAGTRLLLLEQICFLGDPKDVSNLESQEVVRERCHSGTKGIDEPVHHHQA